MEQMNGSVLKGLLISGSNNLVGHKKDVDALNVFPVPDGDTGTNMSLTFSNGVAEVVKSGSESLPVIAKTFSRGLLMGARGNSGVILSQIFRGFYQSVQTKDNLTAQDFADALINGSRLAYKAVMRPVEGTILTVIREASEGAGIFMTVHPDADIKALMDEVVAQAEKSLAKTPELLPVLKEANVVDSGGAGLVYILKGFKAYLDGKPISLEEAEKSSAEEKKSGRAAGYRAEYILELKGRSAGSFKEERFRKSLDQLGTDVTLLVSPETIKVSINTLMPGEVITLAQRYGEFTKIQIENLNGELSESILKEEEPAEEAKEYAIIAVAAGEGLAKLFTEYRADYVVSGGQTMNPSTEDFVTAIAKVNAKHIFILPNNSNIIMASKQAAEVTEDKDVIVLETKSVPQGLSACIAFNPEEELENNKSAMLEAIAAVKTGFVTYAIKDTTVDGVEIHAGDYMAIREKEIIATGSTRVEAAKALIKAMCDEDAEIITLIKGEDATDEETSEVEDFINENYEVDVDVQDGGQPVYSFFIGVE